ncbi:hypothetical protein TNIN_219041 [Trichonephila inaurata madagascariensis]|uniref:Uncharacterized protein n=1 Tax=Trichonephila inaurata madagascariensis TaxID=2747483 RepID=A0A8X6YHF4_9ARAC|nr:hypothetical protein TNIN_219041 [Trichonephila inaurata madagascariensis]
MTYCTNSSRNFGLDKGNASQYNVLSFTMQLVVFRRRIFWYLTEIVFDCEPHSNVAEVNDIKPSLHSSLHLSTHLKDKRHVSRRWRKIAMWREDKGDAVQENELRGRGNTRTPTQKRKAGGNGGIRVNFAKS